MRRFEIDIFYFVSRAAILLALPLFISDIGLYHDYARDLLESGKWPYAHFDFEYPPLAFPLMLLPAWLHKLLGFQDSESYRLLFGLTLLPFDFLLFCKFRARSPFPGAAFLYVLLSSALSLLLFDRFDIALGFCLAWPFLRSSSDLGFAAWWGLGAALKLVPLAVAPARFLDWQSSMGGNRIRALRFLLLVSVPFLLSCALGFYLGKGKISFLSHHSGRGVQIESFLGSLVMFSQALGWGGQANVDWNFGAQHLSEIPFVLVLSRILFWGALACSLIGLYFRRARYSSLSGSWLLILAFVAFGYVLSPQFMLWLLPIGLCAAKEVAPGARRRIWLGIFGSSMLFTGLHFRFYWDYVHFHLSSVGLLLLRNLLLIALWGLSWIWLQAKPAPSSSASSAVLS